MLYQPKLTTQTFQKSAKKRKKKSKKDNNLQLGTFNIWRGLNLYFFHLSLYIHIPAYLFHLIHVALPHVLCIFLCSIISKEENVFLVLLMVTTRHKEIIMQILPHSIIIFHLCFCCCWSFISFHPHKRARERETKCILSPSGNWTILFCFVTRREKVSEMEIREKLRLFKLRGNSTELHYWKQIWTASTHSWIVEKIANHSAWNEAWTNTDLIINYTFNYWQSAHGIWWCVIWIFCSFGALLLLAFLACNYWGMKKDIFFPSLPPNNFII